VNQVQLLKTITRSFGILAVFSAAVLLGNAGQAAASNGSSQLLCFDGTTDTANGNTGGAVYGGVCTRTANGAMLNNSAPVGSGDYSGVYYKRSSLSGKLLGSVTQLSFNYMGVPTNGSPRISLPIDVTGDGTTDFYAYISAFHCNDGAGLVDPIHDTTCTIFYDGGPISGYPNWAAFVAAHPTWHVGAIPFVIADDAGLWTVSNVHLGEKVSEKNNKNDCKKGGWSGLERTDGSSFKNQGDCIQFMNTGK
jgi:hypothetical protein